MTFDEWWEGLNIEEKCVLPWLAESFKALTKSAWEAASCNAHHVGDKLRDDDGNSGTVVIQWNDGDIVAFEDDAAHPNPVIIKEA